MRDMPKAGDRLCIVQMNGCMGETRGRERWGTVERIEDREVYGASVPIPMALVSYDDNTSGWQVTADAFRQPAGHFERQT